MSDTDNDATANAPTNGHHSDEDPIRALSLDGNTILFDARDADRWIQSDTTVDLVTRV